MMSTVFIILLLLAFLHFIYDGIILPSIRLSLRFKLFALRDELRNFKINNPEEIDEEVFNYLQGSTNNVIKLLSRVDLATSFHAYRTIENDEALRQYVERRAAVLEKCSDGKAKEINERRTKLFGYALLANNGVLFLYLFPIAIALLALISFGVFAHDKLTSLQSMTYIPENQIDKVVSPDYYVRV